MLDATNINCTIGSLTDGKFLSVDRNMGKSDWDRIKILPMNVNELGSLTKLSSIIGVTKEFTKVISTFNVEPGVIPAGFRPELIYSDGRICIDLKRDISYAANNMKRPTKVLFSADSANPYEVAPLKDFIANLTCNPAIIYNNFINNPAANIGNKFKDRYEVMAELCKVLGPGVDISIEVDDPFAPESEILEEISRFEEILTPYRLVIKIPHTGPINNGNCKNLLDDTFEAGYEEGTIVDNFRGHNTAYNLAMKNYRINFTLMFEPHQVALALLARPYFINTFIKQRGEATVYLKSLVKDYDDGNKNAVCDIKNYMRSLDMLSKKEFAGLDADVLNKARQIVTYRKAYDHEGIDGLDASRHAIRILRDSNMPDTRLILCSMAGELNYPSIDKMLTEPEFADMTHRIVITAPPSYLARFTSAAGVLNYQRLFLKAASK